MNARLSIRVPLLCGECGEEMHPLGPGIACHSASCKEYRRVYQMPTLILLPVGMSKPQMVTMLTGTASFTTPPHFIAADTEGRTWDVTRMQERIEELETGSERLAKSEQQMRGITYIVTLKNTNAGGTR